VKFLTGFEAAVHADAVIIADLHLGIEKLLFERGIRSSDVSEKLVKKTLKVLKRAKKEKLIIAGDIKENPVSVPREARNYLKEVGEHAEVILVKGNHDGGIERVPGIDVVSAKGFSYRKLGIFHGHAWAKDEVMECKHVLMGHNHLHVKIGGRWESVWIEMEPDKKKIREII